MNTPHGTALPPPDWKLLESAMGEVVAGFHLCDFEGTIGTSENEVVSLLDRLAAARRDRPAIFTAPQLKIARNALRETIRELGGWEFHPRTGRYTEEGEALLKKLDLLLVEADPSTPEA